MPFYDGYYECHPDFEENTLFVSQAACVDRLAERFSLTTATSPTSASPLSFILRPREEEEDASSKLSREVTDELT